MWELCILQHKIVINVKLFSKFYNERLELDVIRDQSQKYRRECIRFYLLIRIYKKIYILWNQSTLFSNILEHSVFFIQASRFSIFISKILQHFLQTVNFAHHKRRLFEIYVCCIWINLANLQNFLSIELKIGLRFGISKRFFFRSKWFRVDLDDWQITFRFKRKNTC